MSTTMTGAEGLALYTILVTFASMVGGEPTSSVELSLSDSCGGDYDDPRGTITSPNYPGDYPTSVTCIWTITTHTNTRITVTIEDFFLYSDSYDSLEFRNVNDTTAQTIERCSGGYVCKDVTSYTNLLHIKFYSSSTHVASGFKLSWVTADCYSCDNNPDSNQYDPACGENNYNGHDDRSYKWTACYTNVHYDGSHRVERGGTENPESDGHCYDSGVSTTCYCTHHHCNNHLCQNCTSITSTLPPTSTTIQPPVITTSHPSVTSMSPPVTTNPPATTSQSTTPAGHLKCYSCINCNTVDDDTQIEVSEEFLSCFTAIELGDTHFVIRGGSPDFHVNGSCRHEDGAFICYCTTNTCNSDEAVELLGNLSE